LPLWNISCKKFVALDPPGNALSRDNVFANDLTAASFVTGIYTTMGNLYDASTGFLSLSFYPSLGADELALLPAASQVSFLAYYKNALTPLTDISGSEFWTAMYPLIYRCNAAIEGLNNSTTLTPSVKMQLLGEAKFMRALFYFYLANLYGDVPL